LKKVSNLGVNVSWLFIAEHSELETAGELERESQKQQFQDKVAHPVNRSLDAGRTVETGAAA
jgi:hypothetical protein